MKTDLLEFISERDNNVIDVLDYKIKDWDDDQGPSGDYIVECLVSEQVRGLNLPARITVKRKCLVTRTVFKNWRVNKNAITWI